MEKQQLVCGLPAAYESPSTVYLRVETEGGLCEGASATLINSTKEVNGIDAHEVNKDFGYEFSSDAAWEKQQ